ncbi:hypothetical protein C8R43DRAFT_1127477 [Mycena crocata]|nr:hypothetical protein C8R43DRAFT_1127477 [Mycena crocata]
MSNSRRSTTAPATSRPPTRMSTRTTPSTTPATVAARLPANTPTSRAASELPGDSPETPLFVDTPSPSPAPTSAPVDLGRPRAIQRGEIREIQRAATTVSIRANNNNTSLPPDVTTQDPIPDSPIEGPITPIDLGGGHLPSNWLNRMADDLYIGNRPTDLPTASMIGAALDAIAAPRPSPEEMSPPPLPRPTPAISVSSATTTTNPDPMQVAEQSPSDAASATPLPQSPPAPAEVSHTMQEADSSLPPLLAEETIESEETVAARRAAKGKRRAAPEVEPLINQSGDTPFLPPTALDDRNIIVIDHPTSPPPQIPMVIDGNTYILDQDLGGFLNASERSERHFEQEMEEARMRSLAQMHIDDPEPDSPADRRPVSAEGSPPKRARVEQAASTSQIEPRITRSRTAASRTASPSGPSTSGAATFASVLTNPAPIIAPAAIHQTSAHQPAVQTGNTTFVNPPAAAGTLPVQAAPSQTTAAANNAPAAALNAAPAPAPAQAPGGPVVYGTADNLPPRTHYIAYPAARPTGISPRTLLGPASSAHLDLWRVQRDQGIPGVYAWRAGGSVDRTTEGQQLGPGVEGILNMPSGSITIGVGSPAAQGGPNPNLFYITGAPQHLLDVLIAASLLSTGVISFYVTPTEIPVDGFLGLIEGLILPNTPAGVTTVRLAVQDGMRSNNDFINAVLALRDAAGPQVPAHETLANTIASTHVSAIELAHGSGTWTCWRVYITPATLSHDHQETVRTSFQNTTVLTFQSEGRVRIAGLFCGNCRSTDHPTPLCTDPAGDGYMGDSLATVTARGAAANRGGRGGGPLRACGGRGGNGNRARGARGGRGRGN